MTMHKFFTHVPKDSMALFAKRDPLARGFDPNRLRGILTALIVDPLAARDVVDMGLEIPIFYESFADRGPASLVAMHETILQWLESGYRERGPGYAMAAVSVWNRRYAAWLAVGLLRRIILMFQQEGRALQYGDGIVSSVEAIEQFLMIKLSGAARWRKTWPLRSAVMSGLTAEESMLISAAYRLSLFQDFDETNYSSGESLCVDLAENSIVLLRSRFGRPTPRNGDRPAPAVVLDAFRDAAFSFPG